MSPLQKRLLSEPLHHFLLLGVAIFAIYAWIGSVATFWALQRVASFWS